MKGAQSISTRRAYGVQRICRVWGRARSSVYARRHATRARASRRRGPVGAAPDAVLVGHIRRVLEASPFHGEGYRKAWAKLRVAGIRTSKERVRRFMREHDLPGPAPRGPRARPEGTRRHDHHGGPRCDVGNGHDGHGDHRRGGRRLCSWRSITVRPSASASMRPRAGAGSRPWSRSVRASANASAPLAKAWPMGCVSVTTTGRTLWPTMFNRRSRSSASKASPSFVREPEGNGVAERFIRTLKENVLWVRSFDTIEELRLALLEFKRTYNEHWMLERYDYRSPAQVRRDLVGLDAAA